MPADDRRHDHPADLSPDDLLAQCDIEFVRRSGPGGQHRNKVSTGVVMLHKPTGVKAEANERRSQAANRTVALFRLRINLALEVRGRREPGSVPSPRWRSRLRGGRIAISATHERFSRPAGRGARRAGLLRFRSEAGERDARMQRFATREAVAKRTAGHRTA